MGGRRRDGKLDERRVSVVIPAYNEARLLPRTLAALRSLAAVDEIVVVDDGSTDKSAFVAKGPQTTVIRLERNRGKGEALQRGVALTTGEIIVLLDADLGSSAVEADKLIGPVAKDEADIVIGTFRARRPAGFGLVQKFAKAGIATLTGLHINSPLSGQRAFHRRVLRFVPRFAAGFGAEVAFTIDAARAGLRIVEVPVEMSHAETGRDWAGFVHRGRQLLHVGAALLPRYVFRSGRVPIWGSEKR